MPAIRSKPHHSAPLHTPYSVKISSDPKYESKNYLVPVMNTLMNQELHGAVWLDVDAMQLMKLLFPDQSTALNAKEALKRNPLLSRSLKWEASLCEPTSSGETAEYKVAAWLNKISFLSASRTVLNDPKVSPPLLWNSSACQQPLPAKTKRKPDIILTGGYAPQGQKTWGWKDVEVFIEITSGHPKMLARLRNTMYSKAFMIFQAQKNRRFVLAIAICQSSLYLNVFDRAGAVHSSAIDMIKQPSVVLHLLMGLVYSSPSRRGYDPTITDTADALCNGHTYTIVETLFTNNMIRGRATICWHAKRGGEAYVIKDSWPNTRRTQREYEFLKRAAERGVTGVPVLVEYEDLLLEDGTVDSTNSRRVFLGDKSKSKNVRAREKDVDVRIHRRLVLQPHAVPLTQFSSRRELISILLDIVTSK